MDTSKPDPSLIFNPTYSTFAKPGWFPPPLLPANNPLTKEGIYLGRKLFYDPILSGDSTQSCSSCHNQQFAFTDNGKKLSTGIDHIAGTRNTMAIINLAWSKHFFWDGKANTLAHQALGPVENPIEMHLAWTHAMARLKRHPQYKKDFFYAFGTYDIDSTHAAKALEQFMLTLVSSNSKIDRVIKQNPFNTLLLTPSELNGYNIFITEKGDCFHCHNLPLTTDDLFHNNGLDEQFTDLGLGGFNNNPNDYGKFKTPTLRNIELTAPYMHDGRFATLEDVVIQYSFGLHESATVDPLMKKIDQGGIALNPSERTDLVNFLKTFTDHQFVNDTAFSNPFK